MSACIEPPVLMLFFPEFLECLHTVEPPVLKLDEKCYMRAYIEPPVPKLFYHEFRSDEKRYTSPA
jgi:hypothetical protein